MFACVVLLASCVSTRKSIGINDKYDHALADSILAYALDHESVYTLLDTIKPVSSVKFLRYKIAADSNTISGESHIVRDISLLDELKKYQKVCDVLSIGDWQFVLMPFAMTTNGDRNIEIYVVRKSKFRSMLEHKKHFFGQWGFTPDADPATVLPVIEYEKKYDRFRGYGYLFGYPDYAVDFFVEAAIHSDKDTSIKIVPRDFFAIPVFAGPKGYFTYAIPKGHRPTTSDSLTYYKAIKLLELYKTERSKYVNTTGEYNATALWMKWNKVNFLSTKRKRPNH